MFLIAVETAWNANGIPYRTAETLRECVEFMRDYMATGAARDLPAPERFAVYAEVNGCFGTPVHYSRTLKPAAPENWETVETAPAPENMENLEITHGGNTDMVSLTVELDGAELVTVQVPFDDAIAVTMCFRAGVKWRVTDAQGNAINHN